MCPFWWLLVYVSLLYSIQEDPMLSYWLECFHHRHLFKQLSLEHPYIFVCHLVMKMMMTVYLNKACMNFIASNPSLYLVVLMSYNLRRMRNLIVMCFEYWFRIAMFVIQVHESEAGWWLYCSQQCALHNKPIELWIRQRKQVIHFSTVFASSASWCSCGPTAKFFYWMCSWRSLWAAVRKHAVLALFSALCHKICKFEGNQKPGITVSL